MIMNRLAIIIPAFKGDFFENTLKSLANQTCNEFTVYIGIDASPFDFENIIRRYEDKLNLRVTRFKNNLGRKDLVGQWERCISLSAEEEWIWLFSDDDYMDNNTVQSVIDAINHTEIKDLIHLNVEVVDENNKPIKTREFIKEPFPDFINATEFIKKRLKFRINSFVVEYIFSREIYKKCGGFTKIDLAWGSDDITWVNFSKEGKIYTLQNGKVYWRSSRYNISPILKPDIARRKIQASLTYLKEIKIIFGDTVASESRYFILRRLANYVKSLSNSDICTIIKAFKELYSLPIPTYVLVLFYSLIRICKFK